MQHISHHWAAVCLFAILLSGCHGVLHGEPDFNLSLVTVPFAPTAPVAIGVPSDCTNAISSPTYRDQCIETMMGMIDVAYYEYRKSLLAAVNGVNVASDIATVGLGVAGTLVPGATTKAILAGIITGINGSKQVINSEILYNESIMVIIATMEADRKDQEDTIIKRMHPGTKVKATHATVEATNTATDTKTTTTTDTKTTTAAGAAKPVTMTAVPIPQYTMFEAARDLQQYYEAGTYAHALITLSGKAGKDLSNCRKAVKNDKTGDATAPVDVGTGACQ